MTATIEATTATTDPQAAYDEARERLQALVTEQAGIDQKIRAAGLRGDEEGATAAAIRKSILPHLIDGARRAVLEREREHVAAQLAAVRAAQEALRPRTQAAVEARDAAHAALQEAERAHRQAQAELHAHDAQADALSLRARELGRELTTLPAAH